MVTTSSEVPYNIPLETFVHETCYLVAYLRWRNEVDGGMEFFRGHENLLPWTDHSLKSGSIYLRDPVEYEETIRRDNFKYIGYPGTNVILVNLSENITDENNCYGSKSIGRVQTPRMLITLDEDGGFVPSEDDGNVRIDVYSAFHNLISMRYETIAGKTSLVWEALFI